MHDVHGLIFALSHLGASALRVLFGRLVAHRQLLAGLLCQRHSHLREVLAAVRAANLSFVLFAGVQPYTQKYVNYFLQAGRTLFATAELIPQGAIYGGEPHYQGTARQPTCGPV